MHQLKILPVSALTLALMAGAAHAEPTSGRTGEPTSEAPPSADPPPASSPRLAPRSAPSAAEREPLAQVSAPEGRDDAPGAPPPSTTSIPSGYAPTATRAPATSPKVAVSPGRGLTISSADDNYSINLRARAQLRVAATTHEERDTELEPSLRTLRFFVAGNVLAPELKYFIQLALAGGDFERENPSPVFDAYLEYTKLRDLNVRIGQYFVPFDRARTIREFALQLVDRQQVVRELSLDRDFGLMFSSLDLFGLGGRLGYNLFVGSGDGRNRVLDGKNPNGAQKPGVLLVARLTVRPFGTFDDDQEGDLKRTPDPRLAVSVAGAYNKASNRDRSTLGTTYGGGTFDYAHAAADVVLKWRGFSLLSEFLYRQADHARNTFTPVGATMLTTETARSGYGYFVQAGQMLVGELEVAARWEQLFAKSYSDANLRDTAKWSGEQVGGGLNYYFNGHLFKLQTDYFYIFGPRAGRDSHAVRLQVDASF